ncbi:hypothetical protein BZL42_24690 [Pseudomonas indica]|nr:hypothetical protein BZL42_24690 [Pseudomonas indica]
MVLLILSWDGKLIVKKRLKRFPLSILQFRLYDFAQRVGLLAILDMLGGIRGGILLMLLVELVMIVRSLIVGKEKLRR